MIVNIGNGTSNTLVTSTFMSMKLNSFVLFLYFITAYGTTRKDLNMRIDIYK